MFGRLNYHNTLNKKIWNADGKINPRVAQILIAMAREYIRYLGAIVGLPISEQDIYDITIHGSLADYYYDKHSDIDLCIAVDLTELQKRIPNINTVLLFNSLTRTWKRNFIISIFGIKVDIILSEKQYFLNNLKINIDAFYSLVHDAWIHTPKKLDKQELKNVSNMTKKRYKTIMRQCKRLLQNKATSDEIDEYLIMLKKHRHQCQKNSVTPSVNFAFKMARNTGIFYKLLKKSNKRATQQFFVK